MSINYESKKSIFSEEKYSNIEFERILVSIGQPGGLIYSSEKKLFNGYVKIHQEMIELNEKEYLFWIQALEPQTLTKLSEFCEKNNIVLENTLKKLEKLNLIIIFNKD